VKTGEAALKVTKSIELVDVKIDEQIVKTGFDFTEVTKAKPWVGHHLEKSDMLTENFMIYGDYVANFDLKVVDGAVNQAGKSTRVVSTNTAGFDLSYVDGVVNGISSELHRYGDLFRQSVTGLVNDYSSGIVFGAIMLWILIVIGVR
jgi:hypothetical protein